MTDNEIDPRFTETYEQAKHELPRWPEVEYVAAEAHTVTVFHNGCLEALFEYFDEVSGEAWIDSHEHHRFDDDEAVEAGALYNERFTLAFLGDAEWEIEHRRAVEAGAPELYDEIEEVDGVKQVELDEEPWWCYIRHDGALNAALDVFEREGFRYAVEYDEEDGGERLAMVEFKPEDD